MKLKVAEHIFTVEAPDDIMRQGYAPFIVTEGQDIFKLTVTHQDIDENDFILEIRQDLEGQIIESGHIGTNPVFRFGFSGQWTGIMVCEDNYQKARLKMYSSDQRKMISTLDNALMVLYALATANKGTMLMHASVVVKDGYGYLFVAPSGTGKSTHSQLWIENIKNTHLLNDDNPVIRIDDNDSAKVYGSPWSGKTPCYLNEQYPIGAVVQIAQAPYNKIVPLNVLHAYSALTAATSGKRWEKRLADGLHDTLNRAVKNISVFHLDCLPNTEAATVCYNEVKRP